MTLEERTNAQNAPTIRRLIKAVLLCVLIAGSLDISDALIFYGIRGVSPALILNVIASGLLGTSAMGGGFATAALGLAIHYTITLCWASVFVLAAWRVTYLSRHAVLSGLVYGAVIYLVMNFVVLPLTPARSSGHSHVANVVNGVLALLFCMGLPISLIARKFAPTRISAEKHLARSAPNIGNKLV